MPHQKFISLRRFILLPFIVPIVSIVLATHATAEVKLPAVLSSHMVLQRDMPVPIWGTAAPGEKVTVKFRDQEKTIAADPQGKWLVKLDPLKLGKPDVLSITGTHTIKLNDILVGEVWVGSGQSNMDMGVNSFVKGDEVLKNMAAQTYPNLRLIRAGDFGWQEATPNNINTTSALLFSFGLPLHKELDVPVGLMVAAVNGTASGYWLSKEAYRSDPACQEVIAKFAKTAALEQANYVRDKAGWDKGIIVARQKGVNPLPWPPAIPYAAGAIESGDPIGTLYESRIRPFQPFAIRGVLWDQGESGTLLHGMDQYTLMGALIRGWRKEWGQGDFPFIYVQKPSGGGCAWDPADPVTNKAETFHPQEKGKVNPAFDGAYREMHIRIMQYPNTAMVTAVDLGSDTHPTNKSGYGVRAARVALGLAYGRKGEIYGPIYQSHAIEGNKIRVKFTHVGQGLAACHSDKLQGFTIAGDNKVFYWADAAIDGDTVLASYDTVAKPAAVRYAWSNSFPWANLFNKDRLPALTFRTDSW